jgi:hypothetical protein
MEFIYIITALNHNGSRPSNIFKDLEEAKKAVESNFFDLWEGYTNTYVVIEKMPLGCPWLVEEAIWYTRERIETEAYINESGLKCIDRKSFIYEIDKPKKYEGIINFGIG